jgi:hypothetical protein
LAGSGAGGTFVSGRGRSAAKPSPAVGLTAVVAKNRLRMSMSLLPVHVSLRCDLNGNIPIVKVTLSHIPGSRSRLFDQSNDARLLRTSTYKRMHQQLSAAGTRGIQGTNRTLPEVKRESDALWPGRHMPTKFRLILGL